MKIRGQFAGGQKSETRGQNLFLDRIILTWRLNSQLRHAGLVPVSSAFLDSAKASLHVPPTRE
jgi:hypothetical protein